MSQSYSTQTQQEQVVGINDEVKKDVVIAVPSAPARSRFGIILALLALYLLWGGTYLGMRVALGSFPPFILAGVRFVLAGSALYLFLRMRGYPNPSRAQWLASVAIGAFLLVGGNGGVVFAEQWVASGLAALGIAAVPLWAALFGGLFGRWPNRVELLGLGLGFIGVVLLNLENGMAASPIGAIALIIAPMCWAFGSIWSQRLSLPKGLMASATQMLTGGAILLLLSLALGERVTHFPTMASLWAMIFLIIGGSLVAFSAYGYLLRRVRPALATSYAYVNPVVAVGLGVGLAGEHITAVGLLAMLTILGGVVMVSLGRDRVK